ncbi:hypothetical protein [Robertkochia sediminum]|uniref:hypothetical protein n=1 Tax=Robertkochia sediminum TaxID=2785326 RepID=UPI00193193F6|nr:hypothetical protein [Robertkochia sediminum]
MKKLHKIVLIIILIAGTFILWNADKLLGSTGEVLDGYNEEKAEEQFEAVKEDFPEAGSPAVGLNPAHGQPGHRCDIPVGSPLDAPAKANTANKGLLAPGPATMTNPPHGQPGHRCDLAVGAPLPQ